jgi:hypothetical protein
VKERKNNANAKRRKSIKLEENRSLKKIGVVNGQTGRNEWALFAKGDREWRKK